MKQVYVLLFLLLFSICSCKQAGTEDVISESTFEGNIYKNKRIGWSIEVPDKWQIIAENETKAYHKKGAKIINETSEEHFSFREPTQLISFQKDKFNLFISQFTSFQESYDGEYEVMRKHQNMILYDAYTKKGIKVDTLSGKEVIHGFTYNTFDVTIYNTDDEVLFNQRMYSRLLKDGNFDILINFNNVTDKETMLRLFKDSKFEK